MIESIKSAFIELMNGQDAENGALIVCDSCSSEFSIESVSISEKPIWLDGVEHIVLFFQCPECNEFYFIALYDEKHKTLVAEYEKALSRYNKIYGKTTEKRLKKLLEIVYAKRKRIADNMEKLRSRYPGMFTVQRDAKGAEFVVYKPLDDGESENR